MMSYGKRGFNTLRNHTTTIFVVFFFTHISLSYKFGVDMYVLWEFSYFKYKILKIWKAKAVLDISTD